MRLDDPQTCPGPSSTEWLIGLYSSVYILSESRFNYVYQCLIIHDLFKRSIFVMNFQPLLINKTATLSNSVC